MAASQGRTAKGLYDRICEEDRFSIVRGPPVDFHSKVPRSEIVRLFNSRRNPHCTGADWLRQERRGHKA